MAPPGSRADRSSFEHKGWRFESESHPILSTRERDSLSERIKDPCGGVEVPGLPGALFGRNSLKITHEASGRTLSFDADGAIISWARESARKGSGGLQVITANRASWKQAALGQEFNAVQDYDWTFSSDYSGATSGSTAATPGAARKARTGTRPLSLLRCFRVTS